MVRLITRRQRREFMQNVRLLEAVTRHVSAFSAQSKEGIQAATEIKLMEEPKDVPLPEEPSKPKPKVLFPPGVDPERSRTPRRVPFNRVESQPTGNRFEAAVEELPDDEDRKVTPKTPEDRMNSEGSFERFMRFAGGAGPSGRIAPS
jgi:hypothetical protein